MKQATRLLSAVSTAAGLLVPALVFTSCSGGGGGGGGVMFIESCTLGCTNGLGGAQVSCGIVNTFRNQDISVSFSQDVRDTSLLVNNAFQVFDTATSFLPAGTRLVDSNNPNRAIFRPRLSFDAQGNPSFGFEAGASYQIRIPGVAQNDVGPYITSVDGQQNQSRLLCTITTNGLIDPVPGSPSVRLAVSVLGVPNKVNVDDPVACLATDPTCDFPQPPGTVIPTDLSTGRLVDVRTTSQIEITFNDLMNIGTLVLPATGQSPFITVKTDSDADLTTLGDQVALPGTFALLPPDQTNLRTTVVFTPIPGFPSGGPPNARRLIVIDIPAGVRDLAGNTVANLGQRAFVPQQVTLGEIQLPVAGGETFDAPIGRRDSVRTGALWGENAQDPQTRLRPGFGGGSGRLGDLVVPANTNVTVVTSTQRASLRIALAANQFPGNPRAPAFVFDGGTELLARRNQPSQLYQIEMGDSAADVVGSIVAFLQRESNDPNSVYPELAQFDFEVENGTTMVLTARVDGSAGNGTRVNAYPSDLWSITGATVHGAVGNTAGQLPNPLDPNPPTAQTSSAATYLSAALSGGLDAAVFGALDINDPSVIVVDPNLFLNNPIPNQPGDQPPVYVVDNTVDNGVFEFSSVSIGQNATLRFVGENPARIFARGQFSLADTASLIVSGGDNGTHPSDATLGQYGALGGPAAGRGGQGGDRPDTAAELLGLGNTGAFNTGLMVDNNGVDNDNAVPDGRSGGGVGGALGYGDPQAPQLGLGQGVGGVRWPVNLPAGNGIDQVGGGAEPLDFQDLAVLAEAGCDSRQLSGPGSGGAYAFDGNTGDAIAPIGTPTLRAGLFGIGFVPPNPTSGGDSTPIALEPANAPGVKRALRPDLGYLRGGAGGGGAGAHVFDTSTNGTGTTGANTCFSALQVIDRYRIHSGAGGGGGGGAIQIVAGDFADLAGRIDATGGDGGSVRPGWPIGPATAFGSFAQPGGGGAGGAILIQARNLAVAPLANRILVAGGAGGVGPTIQPSGANPPPAPAPSRGGDGSAGLVHVEVAQPGNDPVTFATGLASVISPSPTVNDPQSTEWLSVSLNWDSSSNAGIDAMSGAQSCWILPNLPVNIFALDFSDDAVGQPGWDMTVFVDLGAGEQPVSFRTPSPLFGNQSPEQLWGRDLGTGTALAGAPIVVRFQGAKSTGAIPDPCSVTIGPGGNATGLTPWVMHPSELNNFNPAPDIIRWQIVFDGNQPEAALIRGVRNLLIRATPN